VEQILLNHIKRSNDSLAPTEEEVAAERRGGLNIVKSPSLSPQPLDCDEINTPFFAEQLTAFEIWLEYAASKPKNQLVIKSPPVSALIHHRIINMSNQTFETDKNFISELEFTLAIPSVEGGFQEGNESAGSTAGTPDRPSGSLVPSPSSSRSCTVEEVSCPWAERD